MSDVVAKLAVMFTADTKGLDDGLSKAKGGIGGLVDGLGKIGPIATGFGVAGGALVGLGAGALAVGMQFDDAFDGIALKTGATGKNLEGLQDSLKKVAGSGPEDIGKVSQVMGELAARTGQTGAPLEALTRQVLNLGQATGEDAAASVEKLTRMLGDASVPADKQAAALDNVFKASQATGVGVSRLSELMVGFGAPMRNLGMTMEDSAALLGRFEKEGVNTELVMGALKAASAKWAKEGIAPAEGLKQTIAAMQKLGPGAESTAMAMEVFGQKAGGDMVDTILSGKFAIDDLKKSIADMPDGINAAAEGAAGFGEKMDTMKNKLLNALEPLGSAALDAVGEVVDALMPLVDQAIPMLDSLKPALDGLMAGLQSALGGIDWAGVSTMIGGAFTAISTAMSGIDWAGIGAAVMAVGSAMMAGIGVVVPVIVSVMQTLWGIIGPFVPLIAGLVAAFALLSNPIGIAIVAITAIGAASQLLGPAWQGVIDALTNLGTAISTNWALFLSTITTALLSIGAAITTSWDAFRQTIADHLAAIAESIRLQWDAFLRVIQDKLTAILGAVTTAWDNVKKAISDTLNGLKAAISDAWSAMQATISGAMDAIKGVVSAALGAVKGIFDAELNAAKALVGVVLDVITGNFSGALDKIVAFVKNGFEGVIALARSILGLLPDAVSKPLSSALDSFANWGRGILDAIARIARDVLDAAGSIGTNIARGISDALTGAWDGLVGKLKALIDLLPQAVKDLLGIHSPSTVFFDIMIDFIEGGVQGLIKGAPRLLQEAGGLARKLTGAFSQVLDPSKLAGMGGSVKTWDLSRMNGKLIKPKAIEELKKLGTRVPNVRGWLWGDKNHGWGDSIPGPHGGFAAKHGVGQGRFSRWAMNAGKDIQFSGQTVVDGGDLKKLGGGDPVAAAVQSLAKALGDLGQVIAKLPPEIGTAVSEAWIKLGQVGGNVGGSGQVGPTVPLPPGTPVPGPVNPPGKNGEGATYIYNQYGNNVVMPKSDDPKGLINALVAHGWGTA